MVPCVFGSTLFKVFCIGADFSFGVVMEDGLTKYFSIVPSVILLVLSYDLYFHRLKEIIFFCFLILGVFCFCGR